jgi:hypothetical protein
MDTEMEAGMDTMDKMNGEAKGMNYFSAMWHVLKIDEEIYKDISARGLAFRYSTTNMLILGILYGFFSLYFVDKELFRTFPDPSSVLVAQVIIVLTGILVAFLMHLGAAFLFWTFCRAMKGEARFIPTYFILGVAIAPLWIAVPGLTALHAGWRDPLVYFYVAFTGIYAFSSFFVATKSIFGYSYKKMSIAVAMMLVFTVSFLGLWLG